VKPTAELICPKESRVKTAVHRKDSKGKSAKGNERKEIKAAIATGLTHHSGIGSTELIIVRTLEEG